LILFPGKSRHFPSLTFQRIAQKVAKSKNGQNIYIKAQFESPKYLHQTTFETIKYLQQTMFETAYLSKNVIKLLKQKVAKKVAIILGYFILSKNHNEPPKVAQLAKNCIIWSPWLLPRKRINQTLKFQKLTCFKLSKVIRLKVNYLILLDYK
jgi:hypothetical protein